jgi:circadian clock protein KaiC
VDWMSTGVPGLDTILGGGLPVGNSVIIGGPPGAGKTLLAQQIAFYQASLGRHSLILTVLSEPHDKLLRHLEDFAWFDRDRVGNEIELISLYSTVRDGGPDEVIKLIVNKVRERQTALLVLDAFRGIRDLVADEVTLRRFLFNLGGELALLGVTTLLTGEYAPEDTNHFTEFTLVDAILLLSHERRGSRAVRGIQVSKLRGAGFLDGGHNMQIDRGGITVYPRMTAIARATPYRMGTRRLSTGLSALDRLVGGGLIEHSFNLVVGTPGVGKTLLGLMFLAEGARQGEPGLMISMDESPDHLAQKAQRFEVGRVPFFDGKLLRMCWEPAVEIEPDIVASHLRAAIEERGVRRVVLDAFTNLESALNPSGLSDYILAITNYLRSHGVTTLLVKDVEEINRPLVSVAGLTYSSTCDNILLLHDFRLNGRLERVITVVKTRDSAFDAGRYRYTISPNGFQVDELPMGDDRAQHNLTMHGPVAEPEKPRM